jgi:YD repeat-containing protein
MSKLQGRAPARPPSICTRQVHRPLSRGRPTSRWLIQQGNSFDAQGNLEKAVDRNGRATLYTYEANGLLKSQQFADGTVTTFGYDDHANLTSITDSHGTTIMEYDGADRLSKITYPNGRFLRYGYDAGGRRAQIMDQSGYCGGKLIVQYTYDEAGQLRRKDEGNGTFTTYDYDAKGQLRQSVNFSADNTVNSHFDYTYDVLGRRATETTLEGTTTYGYDGRGRLSSVALPNGRTITYAYDAAGNRQTVTDNSVTTGYSINNLNQYTA